MLLDLSCVLSEQHKPIDEVIPCSLREFRIRREVYPVISGDDAHITVEYAGDQKLKVAGTCRLVIEIPCARCLRAVPVAFDLDFQREIRSGETGTASTETEELDENNYIDGYYLDIDRLLCNEILVGWPMRVLCSESCKGICSVCGRNLNEGACDCAEAGGDPRMSVIRDVFKNFKEV